MLEKGMEKRKSSYIISGNVSWYRKAAWKFFKTLKIEISYHPKSLSWAYIQKKL